MIMRKNNSYKKITITTITITVLVIVLLKVFSEHKNSPLIVDYNPPVSATSTMLSVEYKSVFHEGEENVINESYPELKGGNVKIIADVNTRIKKIVDEKTNTYNDTKQFEPCVNDQKKKCKYEISLTSTTTFSSKLNTVSVLFEEFVTSEAMAHPSLDRSVATFDLVTGSQTTLFNLSPISKADLLKKISDITRKRLLASQPELKDIPTFFEGTSASEKNFSALMITNSGINVLFNEYQIGPRPEGTPTIFISFDELGL